MLIGIRQRIFVSAGGTSVSICMGAMGILCNIGKGSKPKENTYSNVKIKTSS